MAKNKEDIAQRDLKLHSQKVESESGMLGHWEEEV